MKEVAVDNLFLVADKIYFLAPTHENTFTHPAPTPGKLPGRKALISLNVSRMRPAVVGRVLRCPSMAPALEYEQDP